MIYFPRKFYDSILQAARDNKTEEICGLIGGELNGEDKSVKKNYFLENTDHSDVHFSINPKEQLDAVRDMRSGGLIPLGCFHSHINSGAEPSAEDIRLAYDKEASYMILSLLNNELKSFRIDGGAFEEELVIE